MYSCLDDLRDNTLIIKYLKLTPFYAILPRARQQAGTEQTLHPVVTMTSRRMISLSIPGANRMLAA
jgi:hypothetical protein